MTGKTGHPGYTPNLVLNDKTRQDFYADRTFPYYIGPTPKPTDPSYSEVMGEIQKLYVSSNKIGECVDRYRDALISKLPVVSVISRDSEQPQEQAQKVLDTWIDTFLLTLGQQDCEIPPWQKAVTDALTTGRGYLRIFSPKSQKENPDINRRVYVSAPDPSQVEIFYDDNGIQDRIRYCYTVGKATRYEDQTLLPNGKLLYKIFDESEKELDSWELNYLGIGGYNKFEYPA